MKLFKILSLLALSLGAAISASAHCQVPCGIFADELKFGELEQHVETIAKAGVKIREISAKDTLSADDHQQLVRWVLQKEEHAQKINKEVADYFLAQRIKPGADHYAEKLELLHHIMVFSMKSKQTAEATPVDTLSEKIAAFKAIYLDHDHTH